MRKNVRAFSFTLQQRARMRSENGVQVAQALQGEVARREVRRGRQRHAVCEKQARGRKEAVCA